MNEAIYRKIIEKKEFLKLPRRDVEMAFGLFDKERFLDEEKIKKTRELLRKIYFSFGSLKLLSPNIFYKKNIKEILKKHLSSRERLSLYDEIYKRILKEFIGKNFSIIDLGAGINGLSYKEL